MSNFENLKVWHRAVEMAVSIYKLTAENKSFQKDYGLKDQMRRAAVSISSNISEGDELGTDKQANRQFYIAKGSSAELYTQLVISNKIGYLTEEESKFFLNECKGISAMLSNLIKSRSTEKNKGARHRTHDARKNNKRVHGTGRTTQGRIKKMDFRES